MHTGKGQGDCAGETSCKEYCLQVQTSIFEAVKLPTAKAFKCPLKNIASQESLPSTSYRVGQGCVGGPAVVQGLEAFARSSSPVTLSALQPSCQEFPCDRKPLDSVPGVVPTTSLSIRGQEDFPKPPSTRRALSPPHPRLQPWEPSQEN
ncbi:hypothetical protein MG293_006221 [Ovis ammon polii]|uniref:Uncharacterized protein n=1 Tax=Ovis ammon polii TaxID=230172 RepID=A0AAD4UF28_OVIAM|nr:hypothetical protein MG293_006221 [Ovis ammon polii]